MNSPSNVPTNTLVNWGDGWVPRNMMSPFFHFTESMERFQLFAAETELVTWKVSHTSGATSAASAHA